MHLHMPLLASSVHYLYNALRNIIIIIIIASQNRYVVEAVILIRMG